MNGKNRMARRYHWLSDKVEDFVNEPQAAVCCNRKGKPFNMVAKESKKARKATALVGKEKPEKNLRDLDKVMRRLSLPKRHEIYSCDLKKEYIKKIFLKTYENQAEDFEELLMTYGLGPKSMRALALMAELIYGAKPSFKDPVRYSFAHGGKDGIPYPVNKKVYDQSIEILRRAIRKAKISPYEKDRAFKRLVSFNNS